jgi:membrane-associated phospholipid phosphatase
MYRSLVSVTYIAAQFCLVGACPSPLDAQPPASSQSGAFITGRDLGLFAGATVATAALSTIDLRVARTIGDTVFRRRHPGYTVAAKRASVVRETTLMVTGGLVYGVARLSGDDGTADVALHTTGSIIGAAMFIQVVRGALGRARPHVGDADGTGRPTGQYDFQFLHGFTSFDYRSFPSMHAMASMAVASALSQEMRRRDTPHRGVIAPALYVAAVAPAVARMYLDEHWASDIAMGMFIGVFSGQKVVTYSHDHPDNLIDRNFLRTGARARFTYDARGLSFSVLPF